MLLGFKAGLGRLMKTLMQNMIILGDAKEALPLLSHRYGASVRCVYIDPPYNNGESYRYYNDNVPQGVWLDEMRKILQLLKPLLRDDGSLWMSIDDFNMHYLKVLADDVFGIKNFVHTIVWQHRRSRENRNTFSNNHEYILVYALNSSRFKATRNLLVGNNEIMARYKNPDNDPRGPWQSVTAHAQDGHGVRSQFYEIVAPNGRVHRLPKGRCWVYSKPRMEREIANNNIWFGKDGCGVPRIKSFLKGTTALVTPETLWLASDVETTEQAKKQVKQFDGCGEVFDTPKPEMLIRRVLEIATNKNDLVLDCFLGSGTTAAVAHKMKRNYIGIERQHAAFDMATARLNAVVAGEEGGVSSAVNWHGGGGFTCMEVRDETIREMRPAVCIHDPPCEDDVPMKAVRLEPEMITHAQISRAEQVLLYKKCLTLYQGKECVLHGTYRKRCRDWIVKHKLYNLRITKTIAASAPELFKVKRILLTRKRDRPLFFKVVDCGWTTKGKLDELGYPSCAKRASQTTYLLYSLLPCGPFLDLRSKKNATDRVH